MTRQNIVKFFVNTIVFPLISAYYLEPIGCCPIDDVWVKYALFDYA